MMTGRDVEARKDGWDKFEVAAKAVGAVFTPVLVLLLGFAVNSTLKQREIRASYVELAVQILQNPDTSHYVRPLRPWAVEVLESGPVRMPSDMREALISGRVTLPTTVGRTIGTVPEEYRDRPPLIDVLRALRGDSTLDSAALGLLPDTGQ